MGLVLSAIAGYVLGLLGGRMRAAIGGSLPAAFAGLVVTLGTARPWVIAHSNVLITGAALFGLSLLSYGLSYAYGRSRHRPVETSVRTHQPVPDEADVEIVSVRERIARHEQARAALGANPRSNPLLLSPKKIGQHY